MKKKNGYGVLALLGIYDEPKRVVVNAVIVILTAICSIMYNVLIATVSHNGGPVVTLLFISKFVPIVLASAFGGAVPGMMAVLIIFIHRTIAYSSFSYLTFIYLLVVIIVDALARKSFFKKWYTTVLSAVFLMFLNGVCWSSILWLLSGKDLFTMTPRFLVVCFLNELPGCMTSCFIVYLIYKFMTVKIKRLVNNGKYYIPEDQLTEDEKYELGSKSKIERVILRIVVFEAIVLGVSAEIASSTLIPTMKYISPNGQVITIEEDYSHVTNTGILESRVSFKIMRDVQKSKQEAAEYAALGVDTGNNQFGLKLAMLISIIVIPLSVFVNRYAQRRIAEPIRNMSRAVSGIYNSDEVEINEKVAEVHNLEVRTKDEIEELYHSVDLTFYRLMEYIELVKTRQNIEDQLEIEKSANEAKTRFLSNISHEIRTPINAVLGFDEMILRESDNDSILGYAKDIQNSGKTLLALINDLLDFSKIEAGKMEIIPVEYELSSVINDLVNMAKMRAKDKNLEFSVEVNENIPHILYGDEIRIKQCILNILTNAVKYTEKGTVTLSIDYEDIDPDDVVYGDEDDIEIDDFILLKVRVKDTGIGIREEDMDKLSSAFERIDEKRNRTIEGTGLGINIVNSLLKMMESKLHVKSEYGKGSEFSFELKQRVVNSDPIGDFSKAYKNSIQATDNYEESFHAPDARILVVDDTKTNLTVIVGLLKQTQIKIDTALSGFEALNLVKKKKYDIIFLDHRMPEMDGIQTFHAMKEMDDNASIDTPVIALTANAISGSREMYYKEGFDNYMSKPVDPGKLEEIILQYLPADKVTRPGDEGFVSNSAESDEAEKLAMQELLRVPGVDIEQAIERCGSADAAKDVMKDFWMAITERAELIEKYEREGDIKNYTIYVHGLKSSARAIGAIDLGDQAEYLEKCGNDNWVEEIHDLTPDLLSLYRSYLTKLEILVREDDEGKEEIPVDELESAYASIKEFVSGSFFDSADDIMKMLEDYRIPEQYKKKHEEVKRLMAAVDRDGLLNVL
ncbi:response regulator [Butyrivibrio sp. VCB2006]|uniref:response regulator n=1 Tax=Butyrivibrio sp. VCB2006 TaxID=1280679 RepID=UPI0003F5684A|nr:response regulator [Butyrivibrio sp. VCB2006]